MHTRDSCPSRPSVARRARVFLSFLLCAWPLLASSAPLTLQQATQRALERAPLLDARRSGIVAATEERARAGALPDPMLTVGIDNLPVTGGDAFNFGADEMTMKRIGVRQDIPAHAKREAQRTLADRRVDEAGAQQRADALAVQRAAAEAWIDVWAAQQTIDALGHDGQIPRECMQTSERTAAIAHGGSRRGFSSVVRGLDQQGAEAQPRCRIGMRGGRIDVEDGTRRGRNQQRERHRRQRQRRYRRRCMIGSGGDVRRTVLLAQQRAGVGLLHAHRGALAALRRGRG